MQSTNTVRPNSDTVSEESAASVHRSPASTLVGAGITNNNSSASNNETDPDVEAAMAREMGRFLERGPPSDPARGVQLGSAAPGASLTASRHTAPKTSTTDKGRTPAQTANVHTTSQKK